MQDMPKKAKRSSTGHSEMSIQGIRKALIEGERSGDAGKLDMKAIKAKANKKFGLPPTGT